MSPWPTFQSSSSDKKCYIVQVEEPSSGADLTSLHPTDLIDYYSSFLSQLATTTGSSNNEDHPRLVYAYSHALTGFSAMLSASESQDLVKKEGVLSVRPERILSLHTTHSPSFLGLNQNINGLWSSSNYGINQIIGVLDTGIKADHLSFSDAGMPIPPATWMGKPCQLMTTSCNNKIIGARSFVGDESALDDHGHGTHTSSTAAGNFVKGANFSGNAPGTASGIAPLAHLSIYKVCIPLRGCPDRAIIAGMDAAIGDGVDVLSISISGETAMDNFYDDILAVGAFRAMEKKIFVSFSAGNDGPSHGSVVNGAPWALTAGASTIDREIRVTVVLQGNNQEEFIHGQTAFQPAEDFTNESLTLVDSLDWSSMTDDITGKMVVRDIVGDPIEEGEEVKNAGGAAVILVNKEELGSMTYTGAHVLPAAYVGYEDGIKIRAYIRRSTTTTTTPVARIIFVGTVIGVIKNNPAPVVAAFSSRGPNSQSHGILKPDVLGPGVNILAAWSTSVDTNSKFNIMSGTSMACPHLSGVAALLKSAHPGWSPAAIKSAIMTTADDVNRAKGPILDETSLPADIFATGAGHVNPAAASDPGLVYDIQPQDYVPYLCGLKYTAEQVQLFTKIIRCTGVKSVPEAQLNYPSFALTFTGGPANNDPQTYTRTVTNVGDPNSSYNVTVVSPPGIDVRVAPEELKFSKVNQKMNYNVTFSRNAASAGLENMAVKGFLKLCSSKQCVTSPIAVMLQ